MKIGDVVCFIYKRKVVHAQIADFDGDKVFLSSLDFEGWMQIAVLFDRICGEDYQP